MPFPRTAARKPASCFRFKTLSLRIACYHLPRYRSFSASSYFFLLLRFRGKCKERFASTHLMLMPADCVIGQKAATACLRSGEQRASHASQTQYLALLVHFDAYCEKFFVDTGLSSILSASMYHAHTQSTSSCQTSIRFPTLLTWFNQKA